MKKFVLALAIIATLSVSCVKHSPAPVAPYTASMRVGAQTIFVQVVSSSADMAQGLSGHDPLRDNQGMLFDFSNYQNARPGFWMKDMKFNLDFIWIKDNKIIFITKNVPAPDENQKTNNANLPLYYPPSDVTYVLEVNAGWSDAHKIKTGDESRLAE